MNPYPPMVKWTESLARHLENNLLLDGIELLTGIKYSDCYMTWAPSNTENFISDIDIVYQLVDQWNDCGYLLK